MGTIALAPYPRVMCGPGVNLHFKWKSPGGEQMPSASMARIHVEKDGTLMLSEAVEDDSGRYVCTVSSKWREDDGHDGILWECEAIFEVNVMKKRKQTAREIEHEHEDENEDETKAQL